MQLRFLASHSTLSSPLLRFGLVRKDDVGMHCRAAARAWVVGGCRACGWSGPRARAGDMHISTVAIHTCRSYNQYVGRNLGGADLCSLQESRQGPHRATPTAAAVAVASGAWCCCCSCALSREERVLHGRPATVGMADDRIPRINSGSSSSMWPKICLNPSVSNTTHTHTTHTHQSSEQGPADTSPCFA